MGRVSKVKEHLNLDEIAEKIKVVVGFWRVQRWLVIRHAQLKPSTAKEIALLVGLSEQSVHQIIASYNKFGPAGIEVKGRGQGQRAYMSYEEENDFLNNFAGLASSGELSTAEQIKDALEKRLGHKVHRSTVYRLLKRHGWRKIVPRPRNTKSAPELQDAFKKTLITR